MVNKNSVATGKNFDLSVSEGCSTTSLQPFRNESIFKCSDAYLAAAVEYHSRFGEKRDFDELIGEGQKIWRGAADYQTRSQEFRCEILKVIVAGTVLSTVSDTFREKLLGWPTEGRRSWSVRSRPSTLVARRIMRGATKQTIQNYADAADEIIIRGAPLDEAGSSGRGNLVALAQAHRKRRPAPKSASVPPANNPSADGAEIDQASSEQGCEPCPPSGDAITKALEAVVEEPVAAPALSHPLREEHRQRREIVLTLNDVDYEKFLRCKKAGTFLIVIVRPVSDSAATGKLFQNTNIMHTPVRRRVK